MEPAFFQTWVPIALGVINLGGLVWAILQSSAKTNADAIVDLAKAMSKLGDKLGLRIDEVEKRTASLEDAYKHLPDKDGMHRLELSISIMAGDMKAMSTEMKAVREISLMTRDMIAKEAA